MANQPPSARCDVYIRRLGSWKTAKQVIEHIASVNHLARRQRENQRRPTRPECPARCVYKKVVAWEKAKQVIEHAASANDLAGRQQVNQR